MNIIKHTKHVMVYKIWHTVEDQTRGHTSRLEILKLLRILLYFYLVVNKGLLMVM